VTEALTVPPGRVAAQVRVGDELPVLEHAVTATSVVLGALATRDWRPMHHDRDFAIHHNGLADIFLNTPTQAAWFERYLTDWAGPRARLGRLTFAMRLSVFPGDIMRLTGQVVARDRDAVDCAWATLALQLRVGDQVRTEGEARVALPSGPDDNPWTRRGERWRP